MTLEQAIAYALRQDEAPVFGDDLAQAGTPAEVHARNIREKLGLETRVQTCGGAKFHRHQAASR